MGFVQNGTVIVDGDNLAIQGIMPNGLAAQGSVIYLKALPAGPQPLVTSVTPAGIDVSNTGLVGAQFIIGPAALKVTAFGLWGIPQNQAMTTLYLSDPSWDIPAMPVLDMSQATPGEFYYGQITPVTLPAGSTWYIWLSGATAWLDASAVVTTGDAAVTAALGMNATQPGYSYGPINFLYELA